MLGFQHESASSNSGLPSLASYLDRILAGGLGAAIHRHVRVAGRQGLAGHSDGAGRVVPEPRRRRSRGGRGFAAIPRAIERNLLARAERRSLKARWRHTRERVVPSPSALSGWLERFHDPAAPKAVAGTAFIPPATDELRGPWRANQVLPGCMQTHQPAVSATLDMDATPIETHKRDALYRHEKSKAYQPPNCRWAEPGAMLHSEFRDGNVPAGRQQPRVLKTSPAHSPASVTKVSLRSDTADYQEE